VQVGVVHSPSAEAGGKDWLLIDMQASKTPVLHYQMWNVKDWWTLSDPTGIEGVVLYFGAE